MDVGRRRPARVGRRRRLSPEKFWPLSAGRGFSQSCKAGMTQFTVVIPTFNRSHLVRRAIDSALQQTLRPEQIIVVDDGSTDDTESACRAYGSAIQYVRQPNAGVSSARNHGIRLARQPWTAFLDSD